MTIWLAGMVLAAAVATGLTVRAPAGPCTARAVGWLLAVAGACLAGWAVTSLGAHPPHLALSLPSPFVVGAFGLSGLGAACALLAGALFVAVGWVRAAAGAAGGAGTGLLLHALLLSVAWFLGSGTPLSLLLGWQVISACAYFLLIRDRMRVRRAAWALLGLSEFGTGILLFALLVISARGAHALPPAGASWLAVAALFAFGAKAGLFPLQVWVPFAEPEAAGDVAGLFSGLLTAVAVVGFLRIVQWLAPPELGVGIVTTIFGITGAALSALFGLIERDAKRVLAYGTLEALGLVFTAVGVGMVLQSQGAGSAAAMAVAGGLTLLAAHAGSKATLFVTAGWLEERAGLRRLDRMGGAIRRMPRAAGPLVLAAFTLAGLPPCGGFLGEWLLIEACLVPTPAHPQLHLVLAVLGALVAVVAAIGFTLYLRWLGIGCLGPARTPAAERVPDLPRLAAAGVWLATGVGVASGVAAGWTLPWLARAARAIAHGRPLIAPTYLHPGKYAVIVRLGAALFAGVAGSTGNVIFANGGFDVGSPWDLSLFALALGLVVYGLARRARRVRRVGTWMGGEPEGPGLYWTAEGLNHPLRLTFAAVFALERARVPHADAAMQGFRYRMRVLLRLEHHVYGPLLRVAARMSNAVREGTQSGNLGHYVGYLLGAVLVGLAVVAALH